MTFSHGLKNLLNPLLNLIALPESLAQAMVQAGKRGKNGKYYPTDLKRQNVILESIHDVTGKALSVIVENGNFAEAIEKLSAMVREEDYFCQFVY